MLSAPPAPVIGGRALCKPITSSPGGKVWMWKASKNRRGKKKTPTAVIYHIIITGDLGIQRQGRNEGLKHAEHTFIWDVLLSHFGLFLSSTEG